MNCCNAYGHCTQGTHCAARSTMAPAAPANPPKADSVWFVDSEHSPVEELGSPLTFSCEKIGYCMGRADCACVDGLVLYSPLPATVARMANVPPEAGNSRILVDPFSDDDDSLWHPLTLRDHWHVYGIASVFLLAWVAIIAIACGYGWEVWGPALRAYLMGVVSA